MSTKNLLSILVLLLVLIPVFSCISDDSPEPEIKSDPIVGDWLRQKEVFVFTNDSVVENTDLSCGLSTGYNSLHFMSKKYNRAFIFAFYDYIKQGDSIFCRINSATGTWTKLAEGQYSVAATYDEEYDPFQIVADTILYKAVFISPDSMLLHNRNKLEYYQSKLENLEDYYMLFTLDKGGVPEGAFPRLN